MANPTSTPTPPPAPQPAPNPFQDTSSAPSSPPSPPAPPVGESASPGLKQKHKILMLAGGSVVFLAMIAVIPFLLLNNEQSQTRITPTPTPTTVLNNTTVDAEARSPLKQKIFFKQTASTRTAYDLTLTVPTAWNAALSTSPSSNYPWESSLLGAGLISRYSPLSSANRSAPASNYLAIIDVTDWLNTNTNLISFSAAQKRSWYNSLLSITPETAATVGLTIANPRLNTEVGGHQNVTFVESSDKQLKGLTYVTLLDANTYDPQMVTMMAGTFESRSVVVFGVHGVRDKSWDSLTGLKAANDPSYQQQFNQTVEHFKANQLNDDTKAIQAELLEALTSLKLTRTGQEAGTVE